MAAESFKRKLTAILSADVKGYSRLMGEDEAETVSTLTAYRKIMADLILQHRGRVIDSPGDNILAEFGSVVDAMQCAVATQNELKARNAELARNRRMEFRIGINLGDVIEEENRIYGDGVNIAARLEALADAGGICISKTVFDHIESKLPLGYEYLGEQTVKNIAKPVGAYKVLMEPRVVVAGVKAKKSKVPVWRRKGIIIGASAVLILIIGVGVWNFSWPKPKIEPASKEKMAFPLPDKPSIAVLPFLNISEDPKQEYFSDGMTEDLITVLSKISGLMVIARNSTFTYKGKPVKIKQVAEELGVRYVLEGSVRRADNEIRINAQLIDAIDGHHLWAERYDGKMDRVFALQDRITRKIVSALEVKLTGSEKGLIGDRGTDNIEAYNALLEGTGQFFRYTPDGTAQAAALFKKAINLDPNYGMAYAKLAHVYYQATLFTGLLTALNMSWIEARLRLRENIKIAMKKPTPTAYNLSGLMYLTRRQHEEASSEEEKGLALDPNNGECLFNLGRVLYFSGRPKEGLEYVNRRWRLDPRSRLLHLAALSWAHFSMGKTAEAATFMEELGKLNPKIGPLTPLAAFYALLGRDQDARAIVEMDRKKTGVGSNIEALMFNIPFKDCALLDRLAEGFREAGLSPGRISGGYCPACKENQLTGEEIKSLLMGLRITGNDRDGQQWWVDREKNGEFTWRGRSEKDPVTRKIISYPTAEGLMSDHGKSWIEGDTICHQFEKRYWGLEFCGTVFRNPKGTSETKDEYFFCNDIGFRPFSLVR